MDATHPIKVTHPSETDAVNMFQYYLNTPTLAPLCKEAEANVPKVISNRSMRLVQEVVNNVYNAARPWKVSVPKEFSYDKLEFNELVATQKANHVYRNLLGYFQGTPNGQEFASCKFTNEAEMYQFLESKASIRIRRYLSGEIDHGETLKPLTRDAVSLRLQNCGYEEIPEEVTSNRDLKYLDLSYNKIRAIEKRFNFFFEVTSLNLSYNLFNGVPSKLPYGLSELCLRGNPIKTLTPFVALESLKLLDISYMPSDFTIDPSFWEKARQLTIVISPDMQQIKVPSYARKITLVSCHEEQPFEIDTRSLDKLKIPALQSSKKNKSLPPVIKWFGIGALIGIFAFIISKFWRQAHR